MKINLKQPKYVLPLIALPFICLFFYVYQSSARSDGLPKAEAPGMKENVAEISDQVKRKNLSDKLDAYRDRYRESDGYSAINNIGQENAGPGVMKSAYTQKEQQSLDSIDQVLKKGNLGLGANPSGKARMIKARAMPNPVSSQDREMARILASINASGSVQRNTPSRKNEVVAEKDPMEVFRQQMGYMDSLTKTNDPAFQAEEKKKADKRKAAQEEAKIIRYAVSKQRIDLSGSNTIFADEKSSFIKAIIDENISGFAGSRIRLKLLDDVFVGTVTIPAGNYLYAEISGFSGQRVKLSVTSILIKDKILPVRLEVYDLDGLAGLYVPQSAFREFTRNLGAESSQGFNTLGSSQNQQEFVMSAVDKIFQSTSSAISGLIRKNKAKIKYSTYIYLIDPQELQKNNQK